MNSSERVWRVWSLAQVTVTGGALCWFAPTPFREEILPVVVGALWLLCLIYAISDGHS